jgi:glucan phosphoethanolaminetransferase (alkaline phosphatase superfamily)
VSAFLGGLFFATLLILLEQGARFQIDVFEINLAKDIVLRVTQTQIIAIPLTISIVLFVFSAFFYGIACSAPSQERFDEYAEEAGTPFIVGFISFFISLMIILMLIGVLIGVIGTLLAIGLTVWWTRKVKKIQN